MREEGKTDIMFDTAMDEVYKVGVASIFLVALPLAHAPRLQLMKLDSYQRFSRSVFFQAMLTGSAVKEDAFGEEVFLKFMELCTGARAPAWARIVLGAQ